MGGYRTTDPETCKMAFAQMEADGTLSRRREDIVRHLSVQEMSQTAGEIAKAMRTNRNNVATRLSELEHLMVVRKVSEVVCTVSEKTCWTWELTGMQPTGEIPRKVNTTEIVRKQRDKAERQVEQLTALHDEVATWLENLGPPKGKILTGRAAARIRKRVKEIVGETNGTEHRRNGRGEAAGGTTDSPKP